MRPPRSEKSRPAIITAIALCYFLAPVLMPLQVVFYHRPAGTTLMQAVGRPSLDSWVIMLASVVVGYGILRVRPWGWWLFIVHSLAVVANNFAIARSYPSYPLTLMVLSNVVLLGGVGYAIWGNLRAPYFNPRVRWWEQKTRVRHAFPATLDRDGHHVNGDTIDFSESGVYVACAPDGLHVGERALISIIFDERTICCTGEVVWTNPPRAVEVVPSGFGMRFVDLTKEDRAYLRALIGRIQSGDAAQPRAA